MRILRLTRVDFVAQAVLVAILSTLTLEAQQFPDGAALLKQSADAFKTYNTYQYTEVTSGGFPGGMEMTMTHQGAGSGKMRIEMKMGPMDGVLIVSNGQDMWMYMAMLKRYMKLPSDPGAMGAMMAEFGQATGLDESSASAKVLRSETLEVDGDPHDCWVVESRMSDIASPAAGAASTKHTVSTHWIDKTSGIDFKTMISSQVQVPGSTEPSEINMTTSRHAVKFNLALDDSLFVFTPPDGAKETDELFPGMKAMFSKNGETPPSAKAPAVTAPAGALVAGPAPIAAEPQAYVPNLMPVERTEPDYPEAARAEKVHGMVELLVTIDPTGNVVKTEALVGPELLRPAAIKAVKQWKFHPVIRNNNLVYAYTGATVDFLDHGKPEKAADFQMDLGGQIAAAERMASLMEKFPRSPQQELADLEQDRGSSEIDAFALPELAKAALKADALDKAAMYANEALQSSSSDGNYGQAVHDGNMVLGLISLRQGDVIQAKHYLLESGKTTGSPVLGSFGPSMVLAKGLLENGERDAVLEYLESCRAFWKMGEKQLDAWIATLRAGGMPSFGTSVRY